MASTGCQSWYRLKPLRTVISKAINCCDHKQSPSCYLIPISLFLLPSGGGGEYGCWSGFGDPVERERGEKKKERKPEIAVKRKAIMPLVMDVGRDGQLIKGEKEAEKAKMVCLCDGNGES
ncbi:hypothetical protein BaRGS_00031498 [Batillaria attramentaria]|uniref:Uncharacterized protein n=1 Tax=Batillaria attramentaria TaxID=370345 RepID=A0ABD0JRK4_9CAEN